MPESIEEKYARLEAVRTKMHLLNQSDTSHWSTRDRIRHSVRADEAMREFFKLKAQLQDEERELMKKEGEI